MANSKPRIRKTIDSSESTDKNAKAPVKTKVPGRSALGKYFSGFSRSPVLAPLAPPGRLLKRILLFIAPRYFINSWREMRQVTWPNRRETWRLTAAVFVFAIIFGSLVAGVDKGLDELFKKVVLK